MTFLGVLIRMGAGSWIINAFSKSVGGEIIFCLFVVFRNSFRNASTFFSSNFLDFVSLFNRVARGVGVLLTILFSNNKKKKKKI